MGVSRLNVVEELVAVRFIFQEVRVARLQQVCQLRNVLTSVVEDQLFVSKFVRALPLERVRHKVDRRLEDIVLTSLLAVFCFLVRVNNEIVVLLLFGALVDELLEIVIDYSNEAE